MNQSIDRKSVLAAMFFVVAGQMAAFGVILPSLPHLAVELGADGLQLGIIFSAYSVGQLISAPFLGKLSDRVGRKPVLLVTLLATAVAHFGYAFAGTYWTVLLARFAAGLAGGNIAVAQATVSDITDGVEERAKAMGIIGAAFGVGFVIGPAIGGASASLGTNGVGFVASALAIVAAILVAAKLGETHHLSQREQLEYETAQQKPLFATIATLTISFFLLVLSFAGLETVFALLLDERFGWGPRHLAYVLTFAGVIGLLVQGGGIRIALRKFSPGVLAVFGMSMLGIGLWLIGRAMTENMLIGAMAITAAGQGIAHPSIFALVSVDAGTVRQGEAMGLLQSGGSIARVLGPILAGAAYDVVGSGRVMTGAAIGCFIAAAVGASRALRKTETNVVVTSTAISE